MVAQKGSGRTIAITGATGYIGRHLVDALLQFGDTRIKILSRAPSDAIDRCGRQGRVEVCVGDLRDPFSLSGFLEPDCIVMHLVYLREAPAAENLTLTRNLLDACRSANVRRLIHCSTADVVGRAAGDLITEETPCQPLTDYARTKVAIEQAMSEAAHSEMDVAILRPTAVFGPGGQNLRKLADDLASGKRIRNYLKACLFGRRRMNQVHVQNVVAALIFIAARPEHFAGDVFIISDDDSPANNYVEVEWVLMQQLHLSPYVLPRLFLPTWMLSALLRFLGKDNINPRRNYDPGKLLRMGLQRPVRFEDGLAQYAAWYAGQRGGRLNGL